MAEAPRYDCHEAFRRLDDFLDRELTAQEMECVKSHLERCSECAAEFQFEGEVLRRLKDKLCHIDLPCDLIEKIKRAIDRC